MIVTLNLMKIDKLEFPDWGLFGLGAAAFFSGLSARVLRSVPNLGIQFLLYEMAKQGLGLD